jgi:hypothetical protein
MDLNTFIPYKTVMECRFTPEQRDDELNAMVTTSPPDFKVEDRDGRHVREHRFRPADMQRVAGHRQDSRKMRGTRADRPVLQRGS